MKTSLSSIQRVIRGEVVISLELEAMMNKMYDGMVPDLWQQVSYPSLKPLGAWIVDLLKRLKMFRSASLSSSFSFTPTLTQTQ